MKKHALKVGVDKRDCFEEICDDIHVHINNSNMCSYHLEEEVFQC